MRSAFLAAALLIVDFFESQNLARRNSKILLGLFLLAVLSLVVMTNLLVMFILQISNSSDTITHDYVYDLESAALISLAVIGLVGLASMIRLAMLKRGGAAIAEALNGRLISASETDFLKKRLLNVVEEMAIASGIPVPPVYVINEASINAFAAGYAPGDAVIGVTQGALENLNRDQLQGVIAHEFSHILNGDMRLNIRLVGVLYGILVLAFLGRILLHGSRGNNREGGLALVAIGLGLVVIGFTGKVFGDLIKAAVSRQREYLADASAVQYTRNPVGIAGALKRIGGLDEGAEVKSAAGEEFSHMYFADGLKSFLSLMSTHPPLEDRIRRIEPGWQGKFISETSPDADTSSVAMSGFAAGGYSTEDVVNSVGNPTEASLATARELLSRLPEVIDQGCRDPYTARAVIYLLLLNEEEEVRRQQLAHLEAEADTGVHEALLSLLPVRQDIGPALRKPVLELALPALRQLSNDQYKLLTSNMEVLIKADQRITLQEWMTQKFVTHHLQAHFNAKPASSRSLSLAAVTSACETLLSLLARSSRQEGIKASDAFAAGKAALGLDIRFIDDSSLSITEFDKAIDRLTMLHPLKKPKLLRACIETIQADQQITPVEVEFVRIVADCLDCPVPPISLN